MKNLIAITALVLAGAATTASAMTYDTSAHASVIHQYAPNADVSQLTDQQIAVILNVIHGGDSESEVRRTVRSLVGEQ